MTAQLSREELKQQLIECSQNTSGMFEVGEDVMCALMALIEGMDSKPVAWVSSKALASRLAGIEAVTIPFVPGMDIPLFRHPVVNHNEDYDTEPFGFARRSADMVVIDVNGDPHVKDGMPLYATPQPAPVAVPDCFRNAVSALEALYRNGQKQCWNERYTTDMAYASGVLNACRAAMQPVTLTNEGDKQEAHSFPDTLPCDVVFDQEPVAYMCDGDDGREYNGHNEFSCGGRGVPLYTHPAPSIPTAEHRRVIEMLLTVCGAAFELADDSCEQEVEGETCTVVQSDAFQKLSDALDEIEESLPTEDPDRPDVYLAWAAMPRAALKSLLHPAPSIQPAPVIVADIMTTPTSPITAALDEFTERLFQLRQRCILDGSYVYSGEWDTLFCDALRALKFGDAYQGAREDLAIWKRRALEAEGEVKRLSEINDYLVKSAQGETRFGEPLIQEVPVAVPECFQRLLKHAHGLSMGVDWNKGTSAGFHREKLLEAVKDCRAAMLNGGKS